MTPPEPDEEGRIPFVLYNMGGVIVNLVTAAVFVVPSLLLPDSSAPVVFFRMLVVIALGFALLNGLPLRLGNVDNDGANTRAMLREPAAVASFWRMMKIAELSSRGVRLRDMPGEWFREPEEGMYSNSIVVSGAVFRLNRLLDEGRYSDAAREIGAFLARDSAASGLYRSLLTCDLVTCRLLTGGRAEGEFETKEMTAFRRSMRNNPSVLRCEIVAALLKDGDPEKAGRLREQFERLALNYPYPAELEGVREILAAAEAAWAERSGS